MLQVLSGSTHTSATLAVSMAIVGLFILAVIDVWRQEVEDWATAGLLLLVFAGLAYEQIALTQWISGALSAAVVFGLYLLLGMRGAMGGGDVKLSVVPGFVLGAVHPLLGLWWVAAAIAIHQILFAVVVPRVPVGGGRRSAALQSLPHVPAMAAALLASSALFGI